MAEYFLIGAKNDETPTYLIDDTTYALSDAALNADMLAEGIAAPVGTVVTKSGYAAMKQKGTDNTWTTI